MGSIEQHASAALTGAAGEARALERATALLRDALQRAAPEIDATRRDPDALLQEEFDLDSLGFLDLVNEIHEQTGIGIPERDFPRLATFRSFVAYLAAAGADATT